MSNTYYDIVLVHLAEAGNLRGVFKAPCWSVNAGDLVETMDGRQGTVIATMCSAADSVGYNFLVACFGNPDLPPLKGKTEFHEFRYEEEQAS